MKIKPLGTRVLVRPVEAEEKTKSGLYIPESAKEKPLTAEVLAVPQVKDEKMLPFKLSVGDKVIHQSYGGTDVQIDGKKHVLLDYKDILAIVEED